MPPESTPPAIPNPVTEAVARAIRTHEVVALCIYGREFFRVMAGAVAFGGEYAEAEEAQQVCDLLNANAAILAHLLAIREPDEATIDSICQARNMVAGAHWTDGTMEGVQAIERMLAERSHTAAIDQLIATLAEALGKIVAMDVPTNIVDTMSRPEREMVEIARKAHEAATKGSSND